MEEEQDTFVYEGKASSQLCPKICWGLSADVEFCGYVKQHCGPEQTAWHFVMLGASPYHASITAQGFVVPSCIIQSSDHICNIVLGFRLSVLLQIGCSGCKALHVPAFLVQRYCISLVPLRDSSASQGKLKCALTLC